MNRVPRPRSKGVADLMGNIILQCDFCSVPSATWRYPTRSFIAYRASNIAGESVGDWAACDICYVLIESGDQQRLAERSLEQLIIKHPDAKAVADLLLHDLSELHQQFFEHRHGPAVRIADAAQISRRMPCHRQFGRSTIS